MRALTLGMAAAAAIALAGCVAEKPAPPAPAPAPPPPPPPAPVPPPPPPPPQDWRDIALTPGDWTYRPEPGGSVAEFGNGAPAFALRCEPSTHQVVMERTGAARARLVVRTSFGERAVAAGAPLPAADPLLDQMAFSRGRFTIAAEGLPMLVIPAWPEPARTIEDCRS